MRQAPDFFGEDEELDLIYIAKRLRDAQALEKLLTDHAVDYLVEPDQYRGGIIFQTMRTGAFFYVSGAKGDATRGLMSTHGFKPQPLESPAE